ncbi:MAG: McrC family protein [Sandaracinus sp.]
MLFTIREHGRIAPAEGAPRAGCVALPRRFYDRLRAHDEARGSQAVFEWFAREAKATQWTGVIRIDGMQIEILPKVSHEDDAEEDTRARDVLLTMLSYAGEVPVRPRELASIRAKTADLGELLAAIFAERLLDQLRRGPDRGYVTERENLTALRGRLLVRQHLVHNAVHRERFFCEHDQFVEDTALNRVLRGTCEVLSDRVRTASTLDALDHCLRGLADVTSVPLSSELLGQVVITRQNERFGPLFQFCKMLIEGTSPTTRGGARETFSLLYDMNAVFERFVVGFLAEEVLRRTPGWKLHPKSRGHRRHLVRAEDRGLLRLEPDILLHGPGDEVMVVDTKWKRLVASREDRSVSRADLYQLYAYSQRYGARRSVLLYPQVRDAQERTFDVLVEHDQASDQTIEVRYIDITQVHTRTGRRAIHENLEKWLIPGALSVSA